MRRNPDTRDPTPEEIARHIAGARDFMEHQPKEATGSCAAILLYLNAQLAEKDMWLSRLGTSEVYEEHAEEVAVLRALIRELRDALEVAVRQYTGVDDDDAQWRALIARCDEAER